MQLDVLGPGCLRLRSSGSRRTRVSARVPVAAMCLGIATSVLAIAPAAAAGARVADGAAIPPSAIFLNKCSSCHTFGKGERIGPDLKGAIARHSKEWLTAWIRSSERLIKAGDRAATELFAKYRRERMPDHDLTDVEIASLIEYLARGGPEADERHVMRQASMATLAEAELGRKLFYGTVPLASGRLACAACHSLSSEMTGATFGPSLGRVFTRYRDTALDARVGRPCLSGAPHLEGARVTDAESLAIRAFLRMTDLRDANVKAASFSAVPPAPETPAGPRKVR
jgi:cytochrome c2